MSEGAEVTLTRKNDTGVGPCITERAAIANRMHADATLSIHADGAAESGHGFHVIVPEPVGKNEEIVDDSHRSAWTFATPITPEPACPSPPTSGRTAWTSATTWAG